MNQNKSNMGRYTKIPVTISAVQWTGKNKVEIEEFLDGNENGEFKGDGLFISTLEGTMRASKDDYIIQGINGEFYPCKPDIFAKTYNVATKSVDKSLHNTTANGARKNVVDIKFWGDGDSFKLISKASSEEEGWMKSTKAMQAGRDVVIQVTTQQRNIDGSYSLAEALTTVENSEIVNIMENGVVVARQIQYKMF
jgi:hypothetical protein